MSTVTQAIAGSEKEISPAATSGYVPAKAILAFVAVCAIAKLFGAWATGFAGDESYTVVISRTLALSYFDHPPLHQWIVHAFGALAGEGWWLRLPFILMIAAINAPLYGLTRCLFGRGAALWALFGFNATAYFTVWPDGYIMPDVPLFLFLTTAIWAVAEILFGPRRGSGGYALLWLAAGLAFGLRRPLEVLGSLRADGFVRIPALLPAPPVLALAAAALSGSSRRASGIRARADLEPSEPLGVLRISVGPRRPGPAF